MGRLADGVPLKDLKWGGKTVNLYRILTSGVVHLSLRFRLPFLFGKVQPPQQETFSYLNRIILKLKGASFSRKVTQYSTRLHSGKRPISFCIIK